MKALLPIILAIAGLPLPPSHGQQQPPQTTVPLIPPVRSLQIKQGDLGPLAAGNWSLSVPTGRPNWRESIRQWSATFHRATGIKAEFSSSSPADRTAKIEFRHQPELAGTAEAYEINISTNQIDVVANSLRGVSRATATLTQLAGQFAGQRLPVGHIQDDTACTYRSLMVDMGRNPHDIDLLKETVDMAWFYKLDSIHLHLTDDQRFAFPSQQFPKLWDGLITPQEFQQLDRYAFLRGVNLIPELDVPGHSTLLRKHYPEIFGKTATDLDAADRFVAGSSRNLVEPRWLDSNFLVGFARILFTC